MVKLKFGLISMGSVSSKMILEEAKKHFDEVVMIDIRKLEIRIDRRTEALYDGKPLEDFDCLYMRGSFKYASLLFALTQIYKDKCFIPIEPNAHIMAHDKFKTQLLFASNKVLKMPMTYFTAKIVSSKAFLKELNYPIILKFPEGTHGKGVIFTESYASAASMVDALDVFDQPVLIQEYVNIRSDIRVIVAGDKIVGSMKRISKSDDVRANAHQGGSAESYVVSPGIKKMALEAAKTIGAGICAVDIIESDYGPLILEVNTSPGLQKITETTKKNIASDIAKYLFDMTKSRNEKNDKDVAKSFMTDIGLDEIGSREYEAELIVRNGKIVLPEFAYKLSDLTEGEDVTIRVSKTKVEIIKN